MALSSLHLERTLVAVNDQPIAAVLEGDHRFAPGAADVQATHEVRVSLGLAFHLMLK